MNIKHLAPFLFYQQEVGMLDSGACQAVLLKLNDELIESQELIKQSFSIIRKSVRKMIRKFDIFNPVDVVRPLCVSNANGEFCFQLRLTQNSDFIFTSEDFSTRSPWTDVPFLTIVVERQPSAISEQPLNESDKHAEPHNVDNDAAAKLVELSTRLEKVEILLDSAMCSSTKGSRDVSSAFAKEITSSSGNLKPTPAKSQATMAPQAVAHLVTAAAASPHYIPPTCTPKVISSASSKPTVTSLKTSVDGSGQAVAVAPHLPPARNSVYQTVKSTPAPKNQPLAQTAIPKANSLQNNLKRPLTTKNNINTSSEAPPSKQHMPQSGVGGGSEYVWRTPAPYLANFDETIESVVAGLDDPNDFTIEPPSTQTAFDTTVCTTVMDFDDFVQPLPTESLMSSVKKKKKKKKHPRLEEQLVV
ncbi:hypothetical protein TSMEX_008698 [Taenia solium]|eukprot:TsM_001036600 transcript=TsM_001036600 gene=TsM_001036600